MNFATNPQGDIDKATRSLDEAEATFTRRPPIPDWLSALVGTYETPSGFKYQVMLKPGSGLYIVSSGQPDQKLIPYKGLKFRVQEFAVVVVEFVEESGQITALKQIDPSGDMFLSGSR